MKYKLNSNVQLSAFLCYFLVIFNLLLRLTRILYLCFGCLAKTAQKLDARTQVIAYCITETRTIQSKSTVTYWAPQGSQFKLTKPKIVCNSKVRQVLSLRSFMFYSDYLLSLDKGKYSRLLVSNQQQYNNILVWLWVFPLLLRASWPRYNWWPTYC